ncbi:MAG: histidinol-phosphatase [Armatimonadota bacterium]|nr:histidinol-phosphatase [Armatimonadota bacterium]
MLRTSYHTHNRFCDGKGEIAEYVEAAFAAGLEALGVTSHCPLPFPDPSAMRQDALPAYCAEIARLQDAHRDRLRIHLGLEFDYLPEYVERMWGEFSAYRFDYMIGSVHFLGPGPAGVPAAYDLSRRAFERALRDLFGGEVRRLVGEYYARVRGMVAWGRADIVGHLDRIKMWNREARYFREDEPWYRREVEATLQACARAGIVVEVNTNGWRQAARQPYPSPWIVRRCLDLGIPLVVTTDAHAPSRVTDFYARAEVLLREVECRHLAVRTDDGWRMEPLDGT